MSQVSRKPRLPLSPAERMRRYRKRKRDNGLKVVTRWEPLEMGPLSKVFSTHRILDARSLALHCKIAQKILANPQLLVIAKRNIKSWASKYAKTKPIYLQEWRKLLQRPTEEIASLITEQSEQAARLRQSSPFAGILTAAERKKIYEAFRA